VTMLAIPDAALAQHVIALGKTGSGKSSKLRLIVEKLLDLQVPTCIVDPKGDWWGLKSSADGKHAGYPVVIFGGEHCDVPLNSHAGAHVAELVATGNRPCIVDLGGWMIGERTRFFIDFAAKAFLATLGGARSENPVRRVEGRRPAEAFQERRTGTAPSLPRARQIDGRVSTNGAGDHLPLIVAVFISLPVMWLWNAVIPDLFGLKTITWTQALWLALLCF
jgi:hypothetical protein